MYSLLSILTPDLAFLEHSETLTQAFLCWIQMAIQLSPSLSFLGNPQVQPTAQLSSFQRKVNFEFTLALG